MGVGRDIVLNEFESSKGNGSIRIIIEMDSFGKTGRKFIEIKAKDSDKWSRMKEYGKRVTVQHIKDFQKMCNNLDIIQINKRA